MHNRNGGSNMKKYILFAFLSVPGVARAESPRYKFAAETLFMHNRSSKQRKAAHWSEATWSEAH
jgi:hypothetical protein